MSQLVSSVELKKADGQPITFNFQFENGLPIKPIIETGHTFGFHNNDGLPVFLIYLTSSNQETFKNEDVKEIIYIKKNKSYDMWIIFDSFYIVLNDVQSEYKKFYLGIFDENKNYLKRGVLNGS